LTLLHPLTHLAILTSNKNCKNLHKFKGLSYNLMEGNNYGTEKP
jgi:hypothetical protein